MEKTKAEKTLELFFISETKIIGIRKTTKPNAICMNEQSFSMEKMRMPLKSNAVIVPMINFISALFLKY